MNIGAASFLPNFGGREMMSGLPVTMPGHGGMIPGMNGMPGMSGILPFGGDRMMSSMMMLVMGQMMTLMAQMMAQNAGGFPMGMAPGGFGMPGMDGLGPLGGSPLGDFLGGGAGCACGGTHAMGSANFGGPNRSGGGADSMMNPSNGNSGAPNRVTSPQSPSPMGPGGRVGNVDIGKLVQALPASRRKSAEKHFPYIVAEAQKQGITNKAQLAYILATATHESNAGANMEELASGQDYEGKSRLGNTRPGDGVKYKGRGYVQLTGRRNYTDWSRRLGMDLVGNPDKVKDPTVAAKILVGGMKEGTFTGKRLDKYINEQQTDFHGARKTVNGNDRAGQIGDIAKRLMAAMD